MKILNNLSLWLKNYERNKNRRPYRTFIESLILIFILITIFDMIS